MTAEEKEMPSPEHDHEPMPEGEEPPPRGMRMMAGVRWVIVIAAAVLAAFMWLSYARTQLSTAKPGEASHAARYQCPMHPQIVSDQPGECPICHMTLEPIAKGRATPAPAAPLPPPAVVVDGGALLPGSLPPGTVPVTLALDRIQSIGVRTAIAEDRGLASSLRATAQVMPPEQGVSEVHVRVPGFVETMHVDQTGVAVRTGQPMISVYSPEILQAQNELLATSQWADAGSSTSSARRKLELLGMSTAEIERVLARREPMRAITVTAPRGGFVTKKNVVLGSYVTPEMALYEVSDLSKVYVVADVFLADVGSIAVGAEGRFVPSGHPERASTAKVDLVYPLANGEARTRRVRMQVKNDATRAYAPGEFGTVELAVTAQRGIAVPRDAIVDTGTATYVFVVEGEGRFTPRVVATAGSDEERIVVRTGLAAGERVVSGATFLIDSESRLQASIAQAVRAP
jgi:Cu(I)/Ag(I) efflux system membrane fusion protein